MSESNEIKTMRQMAWQRAIGELQSVLSTYWHNENFAAMNELIRAFIEEVDGNGLTE